MKEHGEVVIKSEDDTSQRIADATSLNDEIVTTFQHTARNAIDIYGLSSPPFTNDEVMRIEIMLITEMSDEYFDGEETEALLHDAISQLPDVQRTVFNLRYYDEMKYSDMSKMLNTSEGALKASYHLAVKKIIAFFENKN